MISRYHIKEIVLISLFSLILFNSFHSPEVVKLDLDPSWNAVLQYAQANGLTVGNDIAFTYGPLGFILAAERFYVGYSSFAWVGFVFGIFWGCTLAISCLYLTKRSSFLTRAIILFTCAFLQGNETDSAFYFILFSTGVYLLNETDFNLSNIWKWILLTSAASIISLTKFTYLPALIVLYTITTTHYLIEKQYKQLLLTSTIILLSITISLIATGTSPGNFYQYIINSLHISSGYNHAMSKIPDTEILLCGLASLVSLIILFFIGLFKPTRSPNRFEALLLSVITFITWKAGYTRADGHVFIFLNYGLLCICYGAWLLRETNFKINTTLTITNMVPVISLLIAIFLFSNLSYRDHLKILAVSPYNRAKRLFSYPSHIHRLDEIWSAKISSSDNKLKDYFGNEAVDIFGCLQGIAIENGLNYLPSPTIQSYTACTPETDRIDLEHHLKYPRSVLFRLNPIDRRLPTMDDALLQRHIMWNMDFTKQVKKHLLFVPRKEFNYDILNMEFKDYDSCRFGEWIDVNYDNQNCIFISTRIKQTVFGRFSEFLYKTGRVYITLELSDGRIFKYRYIPRAGECGVLISPLLENRKDILRLLESPVRIPSEECNPNQGTSEIENRIKINDKIVTRIKFTSKSNDSKPIGYRDEILYAFKSISRPK